MYASSRPGNRRPGAIGGVDTPGGSADHGGETVFRAECGPRRSPANRSRDADAVSCFTMCFGDRARGPDAGVAARQRVGPVRERVRPRHRRDAPRSGPRGLADVAPHPRRVGLQPAGPDRPRQRGPAPHGVVARARDGAAGGHPARLPRRPLHAAVERRHRGHRRGDRRPDLAASPQPARRRLRLRRRQRPQQPQHRHLRPVHRQHQRRRLLLRARCRDRRDRLGDADLRLHGDAGGAQLGPHHRRRPRHLRPELPAPGRSRVVRHRGPRRADRRGAVEASDGAGPRASPATRRGATCPTRSGCTWARGCPRATTPSCG